MGDNMRQFFQRLSGESEGKSSGIRSPGERRAEHSWARLSVIRDATGRSVLLLVLLVVTIMASVPVHAQTCTPAQAVACGAEFQAISPYESWYTPITLCNIPSNLEETYTVSFVVPDTGLVEITASGYYLLGGFVLEERGSGCELQHCIASSDSADYLTIHFWAEAGRTYYFVANFWAYAPLDITISCGSSDAIVFWDDFESGNTARWQ